MGIIRPGISVRIASIEGALGGRTCWSARGPHTTQAKERPTTMTR